MRLHLRFAVSWNLPCSTAMLITLFCGRLSYALAVVGLSKTRSPQSITEAATFVHPFSQGGTEAAQLLTTRLPEERPTRYREVVQTSWDACVCDSGPATARWD